MTAGAVSMAAATIKTLGASMRRRYSERRGLRARSGLVAIGRWRDCGIILEEPRACPLVTENLLISAPGHEGDEVRTCPCSGRPAGARAAPSAGAGQRSIRARNARW